MQSKVLLLLYGSSKLESAWPYVLRCSTPPLLSNHGCIRSKSSSGLLALLSEYRSILPLISASCFTGTGGTSFAALSSERLLHYYRAVTQRDSRSSLLQEHETGETGEHRAEAGDADLACPRSCSMRRRRLRFHSAQYRKQRRHLRR